jgi:molybdopterin-guanine dinucleotide biosynthesis protein A
MKIIASILAGGLSIRMGSDKAELVWRGRTLLARAACICREAGLDTTVVGRLRPAGWPIDGVEFVPDETPGLGPLGGLITALTAAQNRSDAVLAIACDMPLLDTEALSWLLSAAQELESSDDGLVAVTSDGRIQPLFAVYALRSLALLQAYLANGRRSLTGAIESGQFLRIAAPVHIEAKLANVNSPADLVLLEEQRHSVPK